jgi:hypothetical protein
MSLDNMVVVARINHTKNYNVAIMTWPEVEAAMDAANKGLIQFTELLTFNQAYKRAIKLFRKNRTEYGIMPIDLVTNVVKNKELEAEALKVFVIIEDDKVRIETVDYATNLINNHPWQRNEKTDNLFVELDNWEVDAFKSKFVNCNYGYGILYLKDNNITNIEVLFSA